MKNNDISFEHIEDVADYIVERLESDEELFLTVVGKFEEIKNVIKEMMAIADVDFEKICLSCPEDSDYTVEYVLDCWYNDDIIQIGCVPAKRDGKYLNLVGDETYLFDNCSSKIIPLCKDTELYFVNIDDECDCNCACEDDCDCCNCCDCDDNDIYGFTVNSESDNGYSKFTYYSSSPVDKTDIRNILREFGF